MVLDIAVGSVLMFFVGFSLKLLNNKVSKLERDSVMQNNYKERIGMIEKRLDRSDDKLDRFEEKLVEIKEMLVRIDEKVLALAKKNGIHQ